MLRYIAFIIIIVSNNAYSECNFRTVDYLEELSNPSNISLIEIEVPKSGKYSRNAFKILTSHTRNIPPELRKNFSASISVHYKFGLCIYSGKVRQHGDWKDHISLRNGQVIRSLDIKLNRGNILNSVSFKLLIPETRNGLNEILASLILKELKFISPETFEVQTSVNGIKSIMLFQEKIQKELIEKNYRREGPLYEGDESLLWSNLDQSEQLKLMSLSRLVNDNWFKKGYSSQEITINSFNELQKSYLKSRYIFFNGGNEFVIFPNSLDNNNFIDFHTVLIAMNAEHSFYLNNRKYFYNTLESVFEPIYYDGDPNFLKNGFSKEFFELVPVRPTEELMLNVLNLNQNNDLMQSFNDRTLKNEYRNYFFSYGLDNFKKNISRLNSMISKYEKKNQNKNVDMEVATSWYKLTQKKMGLKQKVLEEIKLEDGVYKGRFDNGNTSKFSSLELENIFSKNTLENKRIVYVSSKKNKNNNDFKYIKNGNLSITASKEMGVEIYNESKILKFKQANLEDWALISKGILMGWKIIFEGVDYDKKNGKTLKERFNQYGLTGCLTIYKSQISDSSISLTGGGCEDAINFISSQGKNLSLVINNSFADALDADFSNLSISSIIVDNAGNDCFDVSSGIYNVEYALLDGCKDKAVSIGEKSVLVSNKIFASNSNIAISAKDFSKVDISILNTKNVNLCAEVKQKKQEFGGALLSIKELMCSANIEIDRVSRFYRNTG